MASKPLRFHPQAEQEYLTALSWYQERSLTAAMSLEGAFDQALERIREAPYRWPIHIVAPFRNALTSFILDIDNSTE
jgi:hypothetical protein